MNPDAVRGYLIVHGTPPEPELGTIMSPVQFPAAGFVSGTVVEVDDVNAYAEIVGWRCRFVEVYPGRFEIAYPIAPEDFDAIERANEMTKRYRDDFMRADRELAAYARRFTRAEVARAFGLDPDELGLPDD